MTTYNHKVVIIVMTMLSLFMAMAMTFIPIASASTINPDHYVGDDSKVLNDNTKILVAGLNVKYSGYHDHVSLVFVTRKGNVPDADMNTYKQGLFKYLGVGSDSVSGKNLGVMILMMPDTKKYAVQLGDGISGDLRQVLTTDYIANSDAISSMDSGNWDAAALTMIALTDDRISSVETDNVVVNKNVIPMTVAESKAKEKLVRAQEAASNASTRNNISNILVGLVFIVVLSLITVMFFIANMRRKNERHEVRYKKVMDALDMDNFMSNEGIEAFGKDRIVNQIIKEQSYDTSPSNILESAHRIYEHDILPGVLATIGSYSSVDYGKYIITIPSQRRDAWWSSYGIDVNSVLKDADAYCCRVR